ncbi:MAG TPA: SDR family NAD(P)-dependent oxidoreductase, partial [Calditrichaeota bacterium]|nr:SDR family NAD(P)-dependent oxidoreductase [Calditrichota bacterium]
ELRIKEKVALICGASQGIGYTVARELTKEGTTTIICSSNEQRIHQAAQKIEQDDPDGEQFRFFQYKICQLLLHKSLSVILFKKN